MTPRANFNRERVWQLSRELPSGSGNSSDTLTIRYRGRVGPFVRPIQCFRSFVTVILEGREQPSAPSYRDTLLVPELRSLLELRSGADELHPTEIAIARRTENLWDCPTAAAVLRSGGAQEQSILPMLQYLGLSGREADAPRTLSSGELRRLGLASTLYNRSGIVLFDRPLEGIDDEWREPMAHLLVEATKVSSSFIIVIGLDQIPECWLDDERVRIDDPSLPYPPPVPLHSLTPPSQMAIQLFQLGGGPRSEIVTRPLPIPKREPRSMSEALQSEAIANPHSELAVGAAGVTVVPPKGRSAGPLTRVSFRDRFVRHPVVRDLRAAYQQYLDSREEAAIPLAIPTEKRLDEVRQEWRLREIGKIICVSVVLGSFALFLIIMG